MTEELLKREILDNLEIDKLMKKETLDPFVAKPDKNGNPRPWRWSKGTLEEKLRTGEAIWDCQYKGRKSSKDSKTYGLKRKIYWKDNCTLHHQSFWDELGGKTEQGTGT